MKFLTFIVLALAVILLLSFVPQNEAGSKKALKQLAKLAAVGLMSKGTKQTSK